MRMPITTVKVVLDWTATITVVVASLTVVAVSLRGMSTLAPVGSLSESHSRPPDAFHPLAGAPILGDRKAKVALIQYADFECPFCAEFARTSWPELKKQYVDTGRLLAVFRQLPLQSHPHSREAAATALCAEEQGKFWEMHDRLFEKQKSLKETVGVAAASELGLDKTAFSKCLKSAELMIDRDLQLASRFGLAATPSFLMGRVQPDGTVKVERTMVGAPPLSDFQAAVDELMRN